MGMFSRFENKAEDFIEGSGGRGRGGIEPVKLAKRASKEMEREKMVGVGHEYAPTLYNILLSPEDDMQMNSYYPSLAGEVETYLTGQGERRGLVFDCPPLVRFIVDEGLKRGKFDIIAESVSPAIIAELRHEEMVRYGIERDYPAQDDQSYDQGYADDFREPAREPEPQPEFEPEPEPEPEPMYERAPRYNQVHAEQPRNYPPTEAPMEPVDAEAQINDAPSADKTIMLDEGVAAEQPIAVLYSFQTQQHYKLRDDRTIIGRETTCDVVLPDPSVSRRHAEILHNETGWLIRDTGSTNGLIVNGTAATQSRIYDGDIIDLGTTQLEFQEG